jgi:hypothetical protein
LGASSALQADRRGTTAAATNIQPAGRMRSPPSSNSAGDPVTEDQHVIFELVLR